MTPRDIARARLVEQRLPPLVLQIFDGTAEAPGLGHRCQDPQRVFSAWSESLCDFVPIWECGVVVTGLDLSDGRFVKFSLEAPDEPWERFSKFSHVVADLLIDLWENETDDQVLEELAGRFEFENLRPLLKALDEGNLNDGNAAGDTAYREWRRALVTSL